jgi:hypothetical protein
VELDSGKVRGGGDETAQNMCYGIVQCENIESHGYERALSVS